MFYETGAYKLRDDNDRTRVHPVNDLIVRVGPLPAREAFAVAYDRLNALARQVLGPAMLVAAVDHLGRVVQAVSIPAGRSLTIGRHPRCGLRLPDDIISLRHLVAHARTVEFGAAPAVQLWDLNTSRPFLTEDGQPNAAVLAEGMLYASVGPYALLFIPSRGPSEPLWPARADEAWRALPPREFLERHAPSADRLLRPRRLRRNGCEDYTPVHRVGPLMLLGQDEGPEDAWGEVVLHARGMREFHRISSRRLEHGVLLGRYERCGIALNAVPLLSRVHLILVRMGDEVLAIDTGSTHGTWRNHIRVETTTLSDPDSLILATQLHLHWHRLTDEATRRD